MYHDKILGKIGEEQAAQHILKKGYTIVQRNYRTCLGEIDIIAKDRDELVFIEVKTRATTRFGLPEEAVSYQKQQKITRTARCFISRYALWQTACRFDVITVDMSEPNRPAIHHICHAFSEAM